MKEISKQTNPKNRVLFLKIYLFLCFLVFCPNACPCEDARLSRTGVADSCEQPREWVLGIEPRCLGIAASALNQ